MGLLHTIPKLEQVKMDFACIQRVLLLLSSDTNLTNATVVMLGLRINLAPYPYSALPPLTLDSPTPVPALANHLKDIFII